MYIIFCGHVFHTQLSFTNRDASPEWLHHPQMLKHATFQEQIACTYKVVILLGQKNKLNHVFIVHKGQLISKGLFGILEFFQKTNEQIRF